MIVAHLSDLHLGHRAFGLREVRGRNVRERDVAEAFHGAVEALIRIAPDVILVAGDVFDRRDPSPAALVALTRGLDALGTELPETPVVMIAGARDTPSRPDTPGALTALDSFPLVETATSTTRSISLKGGRVHVHMMPYGPVQSGAALPPEPDPGAEWNILVAYARVIDSRSAKCMAIRSSQWDYVALGSAHTAREIGPGVHYSGALERVGPAPWTEAAGEKGFLTRDLTNGETAFHRVPGRPVVALAPIRSRPGDGDGLRKRVREVAEEVPGGIDGKIVHMSFQGIEPGDLLALQGELLTDLRDRAFHVSFEIDAPPSFTGHPVIDLRGSLLELLEISGGGTAEDHELIEWVVPPGSIPKGTPS